MDVLGAVKWWRFDASEAAMSLAQCGNKIALALAAAIAAGYFLFGESIMVRTTVFSWLNWKTFLSVGTNASNSLAILVSKGSLKLGGLWLCSMYPRGLLPSSTVSDAWRVLSDAVTWAGIDAGLARSFFRSLGDQNLDSLTILAGIDTDSIRTAVDNASRGTRPLSPIEKSQIFQMVNAVRVKFGGMPISPETAPAAVPMPGPTAPGSSNSGRIKLKMSQVIDQGSDMEIEQLPHNEIQKKRQNFVLVEGDSPLEKEEITDAQLSCLGAKVAANLPPFIDMGVWGPYGDRLARAMKFTSQVLKDGQWKAVELPGAANLQAWEESWRIFRTGCLMLEIASSAVLDRYSAEFRSRALEHPSCWHIAAQADIRCRSEFWPQELRRQESFYAAHSSMSSFSPTQPWNSVIKASANNQEFWAREFEKPAMLFQMNCSRPRQPALDGVVQNSKPGQGNDKKKQYDPQRRDGRYFKSTGGINICYDWSRNPDGCSNQGCPKAMAHVCEWCRQSHRTVDCPQVPGWKPDPTKGRGRGKGGGKRQKRSWSVPSPSAESMPATTGEPPATNLQLLKRQLEKKKLEFMCKKQKVLSNSFSGSVQTPQESGRRDSTFLELFVGKAGLTLAISRKGGNTLTLDDLRTEEQTPASFDLFNATAFKKLKTMIKQRRIRWLHLAVPHQTFLSPRRMHHQKRRRRKLRTRQFPGGLWPKTLLVRRSNLLVSRSVQVASLQMKAGGWFSLAHRSHSLLWGYEPVKRLSEHPSVRFVEGDQCMFNGEYKQSTGWLTNLEFLQCLDLHCPGPPEHHHHPARGTVLSFSGKRVPRAEMAAEYPQGLCEVVAEGYLEALKKEPLRALDADSRCWNEVERRENWASAKFTKEVENSQCVGGLRNPTVALQKLPLWRDVGAQLFWLVDGEMRRDPTMQSIVKCIGSADPLDFTRQVKHLRQVLAGQLNLKDSGPDGNSLWGALFEKLVILSKDPDKEAATWPSAGTPLGILNHIPPGGVFPLLEESETWAESQRLQSLGELPGVDENYTTYFENKQAADELFQEEVRQGFAEWAPDRRTLEGQVGTLVPSAIGVIVKVKAGVQKIRLVHDLRRSFVNQHILMSERIVLPRMSDVVEDISVLLESLQPGETVKLLSLDFSNAFKQLTVRQNEKRFLAGRACDGWFYYHKVLFGIRTGPLVWARMAALVARCTQSLLPQTRARLQLFVDDPILALRGTPEQIEDMAAKILLLWSVLGLQIAWKKGTLSHTTDWIGANVTVNVESLQVTVQVPAEKIAEWKTLADSLLTKQVVTKTELQKFTGKMQWAAGFARQAKPFVRMLHAALHSEPTCLLTKATIYGRQIRPAVRWLRSSLDGFHQGLTWVTSALSRNTCCLDFYVDASPWGGGAVRLVDGRPVETFALAWTEEDEKQVKAVIGDPGSQALWESYMMLRCLWNWMTPDLQGFVRIRGDAEGVLAALVKLSAKSPLLNRIVKEASLHLAVNFRSLEALHVWSEDNTWADSISRVNDPNIFAEYPPELCALPRVIDSPQFWHHE